MPWKSEAQKKWANSDAGKKSLSQKQVDEGNAASEGMKLPERVAPKKIKRIKDIRNTYAAKYGKK